MIARLLIVLTTVTACRDPQVAKKWIAQWEEARACMLGNPEYGPDSLTAQTVSSLLRKTECSDKRTALILLPDKDRPSIPDWDGLRRELDGVTHPWADGAAIDRVDARVAKLHEQLGLPPIVRDRSRTVQPLPAGTPITIGQLDPFGLDHGRFVSTREGDNWIEEVEIEAPDQVRATRFPKNTRLAYPSRSWVVSGDGTAITAVELATSKATEIKLPGSFYVSRAMDSGATRAVFLQSQERSFGFAVAVSTDNGRTWRVDRSADVLSLDRSAQNRTTGAVSVLVHSEGYAYIHRFAEIDPWRFAERVEIPKFEYQFVCRHNDVVWSVTKNPRQIVRIAHPATSAFRIKDSSQDLVDCTETSAVLLHASVDGTRLEVCRGNGCGIVHTGPHPDLETAGLLDDGRWLYAAAKRDIIGVWREGQAEPVFYRAPTDGLLARITVLRGVPYLMIVVNGQYQLVPLP